jgi:hypothetical protein
VELVKRESISQSDQVVFHDQRKIIAIYEFYRSRFIHPEERTLETARNSIIRSLVKSSKTKRIRNMISFSFVHQIIVAISIFLAKIACRMLIPKLSYPPHAIYLQKEEKADDTFLTAANFVFLSLNSDLCISLSRQDAIN